MYTGITGALKINNPLGKPITIAYISGWNVENNTEMVEVTEFSSVDKKVVPCSRSWRASANGVISFEGANGQKILFEAMDKGKQLLFYFYLNDKGRRKRSTYFCGEGFIESLSVDLSAEDVGKVSISVAGNDKLKLCVNDVNLATGNIYTPETIQFEVVDQNLKVNVPDSFANSIKIENGRLIINI